MDVDVGIGGTGGGGVSVWERSTPEYVDEAASCARRRWDERISSRKTFPVGGEVLPEAKASCGSG